MEFKFQIPKSQIQMAKKNKQTKQPVFRQQKINTDNVSVLF